jgi:hypothetical protein
MTKFSIALEMNIEPEDAEARGAATVVWLRESLQLQH